MSLFGDLMMYGRFAWTLPRFLRHPITLEEARQTVRQRLAERDDNFLRLVERAVFGWPRSPYLPLMKLAGCEMGDIRELVRAGGVEGTLRSLREAGVYFTFEEFKGYEPVVRGGKALNVQPADFDNPYLTSSYQVESGGSTGAGTRVDTDLDHLAAQSANVMLTDDAHGALDVPMALWRPVLPSGSGINKILRAAHFGRIAQRWFSPIVAEDLRPSAKYRLATQGTVVLGRLCGVPFPWPEAIDLDQGADVARWAVDTVGREGGCLILTTVSCGLRVCVAAADEGMDLTGVVFRIAGEPVTPAKAEGIARTGARYYTTYGLAEVGRVGMGCAEPADCGDLHLLRDTFALIQYPRQVFAGGPDVQAFNLTTLLPSTPKVMLNVEIDDYGILERRSCGCPLEEYGFPEHLREIRSFRKLTGEGVTLVGSDMINILERLLPARFGGSSLDYQLLEEEDDKGFTRLSLVVSPRIGTVDEASVIDTAMKALAQGSVAADMARAYWEQADTFRVRRQEPVWTSRGKFMPLHITGKGRSSQATSTDRE